MTIYLLILYFFLILFSIYVLIFAFYDLKNKVFFAPSGRAVKEFFTIYPFEENKVFFDLGSGYGRIVFLAEKNGLKAYGIENNPALYFLANFLKKLRKSKATFIKENFMEINLDSADYIYMYLTSEFLDEIEDDFFSKIKNGSKVISYKFKFSRRTPKELYLNKFYVYEK
jgi:predicted RNA methylase